MYAMVRSNGSLDTGKNAEDKKSRGIIKRFMISGNDWKSFIFDAKISPNPTEVNAINNINNKVMMMPNKPAIGVPSSIVISKMMYP